DVLAVASCCSDGHPVASSMLYLRIELWCLPSIEHAVVADHADAAQSRATLQSGLTFKGFGRRLVTPGQEQDDFARRKNGGEYIPANETQGIGRKAQPSGDICRSGLLDPCGRPFGVDQGYGGPFAG